jgi:hypothetical protein
MAMSFHLKRLIIILGLVGNYSSAAANSQLDALVGDYRSSDDRPKMARIIKSDLPIHIGLQGEDPILGHPRNYQNVAWYAFYTNAGAIIDVTSINIYVIEGGPDVLICDGVATPNVDQYGSDPSKYFLRTGACARKQLPLKSFEYSEPFSYFAIGVELTPSQEGPHQMLRFTLKDAIQKLGVPMPVKKVWDFKLTNFQEGT